MKGSKLYDYASTMSVYELNRFSKFMHSPLHNEDEKSQRFVDVLIPYIKTADWEGIDAKTIWKKIFDKSSYNHAKYIRLASDTVKKLESFLVLDRFKQQELLQHEYLLEIMGERKLGKHFTEFFDLTLKRQQRFATRDAQFYYLNFSIQQQQNSFLENKDQRSAEKNLDDVIDSLDVYYLIQKLKYSAALLHYKNFLSIETEIPLLQPLLKLLEEKNYDIPAIEIYRYIVLSLIEDNSGAHFKKLKELIIAHQQLFVMDEVKAMYAFAMNYCINQINFGKSEYLHEILSLYKSALQSEVLLEDGWLSQWDYKNIVTTALRVKDFKWAEKFLNEYKPRLPKPDRQNAYTFNLARYYFAVKKYDQVLSLLQTVKYNDIFYQLDSKTTLLKTYYELGEELPLDSLKDSFRILLRRKRLITPQQKANYMNLLKFTQRLFKIDVKDKPALKALRDEIHSADNVADKSWLVDKVNEITG